MLAFFTGGYFATARDWAGLAVWLALVVALLGTRHPLPRSRGALLAVAGLAGLAVWTLVSLAWAPVAGDAYAAAQIVFVYVGALAAGALLMREARGFDALEPVAGAGILPAIGYGLSERLLPGLLQFTRSASAQGRLEQPLTYWNAMGVLAAIGLVLCARLAGDESRSRVVRAGAAAAGAPLGMGLYICLRGSLFACFAGVIALVVLAPAAGAATRAGSARRAALVLAAIAAAPMPGVTRLGDSQIAAPPSYRFWQTLEFFPFRPVPSPR